MHAYAPPLHSCAPTSCTPTPPSHTSCTKPASPLLQPSLPCCASCTLRPQSCASALLLAIALSLPHLQKKQRIPDKIAIIFVFCFCYRDQ
ncbi:hypothetical protein SLEP1_g55644 [Rubroshorea leprosula]|uniref:Uncharacterized protein n=1 Tax=Rubroshorea leprosula TaxID=152421 RepID=A0AAV5MH51_9ROSI|nr:hypothetical protein SLEP1_g55644 [Rubroshorea leprosula]